MTDKYAEIWSTVIECANQYGVKAFTGWGISDSLNWLRSEGCNMATMITESGEIKDYAKKLFESKEKKSQISMKKVVQNAVSNISTAKINEATNVENAQKDIKVEELD